MQNKFKVGDLVGIVHPSSPTPPSYVGIVTQLVKQQDPAGTQYDSILVLWIMNDEIRTLSYPIGTYTYDCLVKY
jgi:hypothetical protein